MSAPPETIPFASLLAAVPGHRREINTLLRLRGNTTLLTPASIPLRAAVAVAAAVLAHGVDTPRVRQRVFDAVMADRLPPEGRFVVVHDKGKVTVSGETEHGRVPVAVLDLGHIAARLRAASNDGDAPTR